MVKTNIQRLADPPRLFRGAIARGLAAAPRGAARIDRTGGDYGGGLIRGLAVITRGEALGHGVWIDGEFLRQTAAGVNADPDGVRARFTHPGMSGDGLGRKLGRVKNARVDGDVVRADLHFSQTSHKTPEGDLAAYVMDLAEEDPDLFGASIVFRSDRAAERAFEAKHGGAGSFKSPDPLNAKNLPHARLAELRATDVVDEPAANPSGLFHASGIPADAEALLDYALGLKDARPAASSLGIDPDRLRAFTARFMDRHGLTLKPLASPPAAGRRPARESAWAEHARRFGAEAGLHYFSLGLSVEAAAAIHGTRLAARLLRHDAAADLTATQAGGVFGLDAAGWSAVAPPPDFESRGHGYWRATSLAAWIAGGFRGRSGTPRPELLARFGGTEPEVVWTPRELALGSRNLAKVADGIKLPG